MTHQCLCALEMKILTTPLATERDDYLISLLVISFGKLHVENNDPFTSIYIHFVPIRKFITFHHHHHRTSLVSVSKRSLDLAPPKPQFSTGSEISKSSCASLLPQGASGQLGSIFMYFLQLGSNYDNLPWWFTSFIFFRCFLQKLVTTVTTFRERFVKNPTRSF